MIKTIKTLLIILSIAAVALIAVNVIMTLNNDKCKAHTYDNACDATCNECG